MAEGGVGPGAGQRSVRAGVGVGVREGRAAGYVEGVEDDATEVAPPRWGGWRVAMAAPSSGEM